MLAIIPVEAACDQRLSSAARNLLVYWGAANAPSDAWHAAGWTWEPLRSVADHLHVTLREAKAARHQLLKYGYLERHIGIFYKKSTGKEVHHYCYRVVLEEA